MSTSEFSSFVDIAVVVGSCLLVPFLGAVVGVLVFRRVRRTTARLTQAPTQQGEDFLRSVSLRPWQADAWTDLSSRWEGWWRTHTRLGRQQGYAQGVITSLHEPHGAGWIAFTIRRHDVRNAQVILQTSHQRLELRVTATSRLDANVQVQAWIDGAAAGGITVHYPICSYRSAGDAIEARWTAEVRWNNEVRALNRLMSRDVCYDPLTVNGRPIAALTDTWIRYPHPESQRAFHPALQAVRQPLTAGEQRVLLIALGMALYYDQLRNRRVIYDW